ncbi:restriction endonuclease subunit S [Hymenobacter bucti]|uniref:Restriction endonuclease subunit S n=1 Tax=Hymenobacter bucti TaxID=1844114 RepID=A0ABW4QYK4_9BACT
MNEEQELPQGWVWTGFAQLAAREPNALKAGPFGSALKKEYYVSEGYKVYGQEQVIRQDAFYGDYFIDESRYEMLSSCRVKPGDILVSLVGTIGKVLILPEGISPGIINPRLVKLSLNKDAIKAEFAKMYLDSPTVKSRFSNVSHGGTMDILNLSTLKDLPVPLPPCPSSAASWRSWRSCSASWMRA